MEETGSLDAVVNAAGSGRPAPFLEATDEVWLRTLDVNLLGTVRVCRAALPHLRELGRSNARHRQLHLAGREDRRPADRRAVLGGQGGRPVPDQDARRPSSRRRASACNAVAPGIVDTAFLDGVPGIRDRGSSIPLGRIGRPGGGRVGRRRSCSRTRPPTSPARSSTSTAASSWTERVPVLSYDLHVHPGPSTRRAGAPATRCSARPRRPACTASSGRRTSGTRPGCARRFRRARCGRSGRPR